MQAPGHHPPDSLSVREGRLFIEEADALELVERFGSPIFVFSEAQVLGNYRRFRDAFAQGWTHGPVDVMPAMKANTLLAIRQILSNEGAGVTCTPPRSSTAPCARGGPGASFGERGRKEKEHLAAACRPGSASP